jgi:hypothetical protein
MIQKGAQREMATVEGLVGVIVSVKTHRAFTEGERNQERNQF